MEAKVGKLSARRGGRPRRVGEDRLIYVAEGGVVLPQERKDVYLHPGAVPQLDRLGIIGEAAEDVGEHLPVLRDVPERPGKLDEKRGEFPELDQRLDRPVEGALLYERGFPRVGETLEELHREAELREIRYFSRPLPSGDRVGDPVEG